MKILIVGDIPPSPNIMGNQKFLMSHIELLRNMGHSVNYLYIDGSLKRKNEKLKFDSSKLNDVQIYTYPIPFLNNISIKLKKKIYNKFNKGQSGPDSYYPYGLENYINKLQRQENFDACFINYYYTSKVLSKISIPLKGFYTHDSFINRSVINQCTTPSLSPNGEARALQRAPIIFALQDMEAILFKKLAPLSQVKTIYMPLQTRETVYSKNHNLLFLGGKAYFNVEGIKWFIKSIWPHIKIHYKDAKLIIGGTICETLSTLEDSQDIILYGKVKDIDKFYALGDIAINPVFHGSGLKIKTLEGIEYNKVVISSTHSAEGIYNLAKAPILIADDRIEWLSTLDKLWKNDDCILRMKSENVDYIKSLNNHIIKEYESILL